MRSALSVCAFFVALSFAPAGAAAQVEVLVFVEGDSPLVPLLTVEFSGRGWQPVFVAPVAAPARHTVETGAVGSLSIVRAPDGSVTLRAFRTDRGTSAQLEVSAEAAADAEMVCLVAASLLEELLAHRAVLMADAPEVPEPPPPFPPPVWFYLGTDVGMWIRVTNVPAVHVTSRLSCGLQLGDGFRVGAVTSIEGNIDRPMSTLPVLLWGVEAGARFSFEQQLSIHFGVQTLGGVGPARGAVVIERVLRELLPGLERLARRLVGPRPEVEDVTQEMLTEIASALHRFEGRCSISTLAHRIAVRTAGHFFRRSRRRLSGQDVADVPDEDPGPEDTLAARQSAERLYRHLDTLSEIRRTAFVLCCIEEMSPTEAAEVVGVSALTMRSRIFEARGELAALLERDAACHRREARVPPRKDGAR